MKQELESIFQLLLPLVQEPGNTETSEGADQQEDLRVMLQQLKGVAQTLTQTARTQVSSSSSLGGIPVSLYTRLCYRQCNIMIIWSVYQWLLSNLWADKLNHVFMHVSASEAAELLWLMPNSHSVMSLSLYIPVGSVTGVYPCNGISSLCQRPQRTRPIVTFCVNPFEIYGWYLIPLLASLHQGLNQAFVACTGDHCGTVRAAQELRDQVTRLWMCTGSTKPMLLIFKHYPHFFK